MKLGEALVMLPLIGLIVFLGVFPKPVLERIEPSVNKLIEHIEAAPGVEYRQPVVAAEGTGE
jgi:NADH-quinone oxidoreductase subunit M